MIEKECLTNYCLFKKKLNEIGISTEKFDDVFGDRLANSAFQPNADSGVAYDGALLHVILRVFTPFALKINELLPEELRVEKSSLIKVCLLVYISKCFMLRKNDNQWEIEKRGMLYKWISLPGALKMGMRSFLIAQDLGVTFNLEEAEAMTVLDRSEDDEQTKFFASTLSIIIKQATELTYLSLKNKK